MTKKVGLIGEFFALMRQSRLSLILFLGVAFTVLFRQHVYFKIVFCVVALLVCSGRWAKDTTIPWLIMFSITYALITFINHSYGGVAELIGYLIAPYSFYVFGKYMVEKNRSDSFLSTFFLLTILLLGIRVYWQSGIAIFGGEIISTDRHLLLGDEDSHLNATLLGTVLSLGFAGLPYFLYVKNDNSTIRKSVYLLLTVFSLLSVIHLLNRTGLFVMALALFTSFLYRMRSGKIKTVFLLVAVIVLIYFLFTTNENWNEIFSAYQVREESTEQSILTGGGRFYRWGAAIVNMFIHPFGWEAKYGYVHNFWLDVARVAGILPFGALFIATIKGLSPVVKMSRVKSDGLIVFIIALNVCFFFTCLVEPIMEGVSTYAYLFFMQWGIQKRYYELLQTGSIIQM